jgi:hypothetical protein
MAVCRGRLESAYRSHRPIRVVRVVVARESAGVVGTIIGDWGPEISRDCIFGHDFQVEVDHALARDVGRIRSHAVRGVAYGAGESCINMQRMLAKAGIGKNVREIVTLSTQGVGSTGGGINYRWK